MSDIAEKSRHSSEFGNLRKIFLHFSSEIFFGDGVVCSRSTWSQQIFGSAALLNSNSLERR